MIRQYTVNLLRKSPFLRFLALPLLFCLFVLAIAGLASVAHKEPVLTEITPSIGEPGEVLVIRGRHFGPERGDSWVEIAGNRLTSSSYISWSDTTIMATLPQTIDDGLVTVYAKTGKSNPLIFGNRNNMPVAAREKLDSGLPVIEKLDTDKTEEGKLVVISGKNFGITRGDSEVLFAWQLDQAIPASASTRTGELSVACSERDFDYESWSDQELRVRVPDGATSGDVYIKTDRGLSNPIPVQIAAQTGTRKYSNRRTYVLSMQVDISGVVAGDGNMLFVRVPVPERTASQRDLKITASSPEPYMENYKGTILHQLENLKTGRNERITHSFLLTSYAVSTAINPALVRQYSEPKSPLYLAYTASDRIIPSDNQEIILRAAEIVGQEKNPYRKARLVYDWVTANIKPTAVQNPDRTAIEALKTKSGDAYDMAMLFTSLARAAGIPSIPVAGILVDAQRDSHVHWWAEFYLEGFGWVPVDPGLAVNLPFAARADAQDWYFGNLDAGHIAFSLGWSDQKPMTTKSRIVYKPRSFAFQPIWEESGGNIKGYTSFWADPKVTGIY